MRYEGTIYRPPGEWKSYLLQCTVGCSHNTCTFCAMYKDKRYRVRPMAEILEDIEMARDYYAHPVSGVPQVRRVFLCDGDAIAMDMGQLLTILERLREAFPLLERVTTYAGPQSTLEKTPEELKALCEAGLTRAYLGVETGWSELLRKVGKGVSAEEMLEAGVRLREAGMDLWIMILLGLAGTGEPSRTHIERSVELVNAMRPRHLSALTYVPEPGTPMYRDIQAGRFCCISAEEALLETKWLVEGLQVEPLHFTANHASNYLPLKGGLPEDRAHFLAQLEGALSGETGIRQGRHRVL